MWIGEYCTFKSLYTQLDFHPFHPFHLRRAATGRVIAAAGLTTTGDRNISEGESRAATITTENVVVIGIVSNSTSHISESNVTDSDSVGGLSSGATVEVVLLDIDTVVGDARHSDVLVDNIADL
jgi:hypothetical protein